jgi:hypothetical protein
MKRPGWVIVIGIMGIIISLMGIVGTGKSMIAPRVVEFIQNELLPDLEDIYEGKAWEYEELPPEELLEMARKFLTLPDWFYKLSIIFGIIGFFIYVYYLFSSVWFILIKKNSVRLLYIAIALSMFLSLSRIIAASFTRSFIGFIFMSGSVIGIAINIILLIVIAVSDKSVFDASKT